MTESVYKKLAMKLDSLPNGFPPAEDESELRLLEYLFEDEEAGLGAQLTKDLEDAGTIAERAGRDKHEVRDILKGMADG
jgi:hypothetical protein